MNRTTRVAVLLLLSLICFLAPARATFSIVAVDPETGQVGSAGASCIAGAIILSDVHPGVGGIHTQAYWNNQNQQYARMLMDLGYSPEVIIDSLVAHDAQGNPTIRQYGIVDLVDGGRSAAYTGSNCTDYKGHILGSTYAIQGNILENMEAAFLSTAGTLADRLMAALQAAKVPGADTRCAQHHKSSISAFLRVALPSDLEDDLYLHLNVNNTPTSVDPIDLLQNLYDQWVLTADVSDPYDATEESDVFEAGVTLYASRPNPFRDATVVSYLIPRPERVTLKIYDLAGRAVATLVDRNEAAGFHQVAWSGAPIDACGAAYICRLDVGGQVRTTKMLQLSE
jgi:uncharacterized Ntn-hydrolase superfamily protein